MLSRGVVCGLGMVSGVYYIGRRSCMKQWKDGMSFAKWVVVASAVCMAGCVCTDRRDAVWPPYVGPRLARFFQENDPNGLEVIIEGKGGVSGLSEYDGLKGDIVNAVRNDTRRLRGRWPGVEGASFSVYVRIEVAGDIESLVICLDCFGFSIGAGSRNRIVNRDLARCVEEMMRRSRCNESEYWPEYELALKKGAGDAPAEAELPEKPNGE